MITARKWVAVDFGGPDDAYSEVLRLLEHHNADGSRAAVQENGFAFARA